MTSESATAEIVSGPERTRLLSLDVFRGLTIAAMILVNNPGSWEYVYPPLRHATWDGWTPTDLIFPFFVLIVGVAMPLTFDRRLKAGETSIGLAGKVLRRAFVLFALGVFLNGFPKFDPATIRIPGVLQRIALCYLGAAMILSIVPKKAQAGLTFFLLIAYWGVMTFAPYGVDHAPGDLSRPGNLAARIDRDLLSGHLYKSDYDPEGLVSTLPAIATAMLGVFAGRLLMSDLDAREKLVELFGRGALLTFLGLALDVAFPINKALWTSTFVILTAGLGYLLLGLCHWLIEIKGKRAWTRPFKIFGMNAIAAYVIAAMLARALGAISIAGTSVKEYVYGKLFAEHMTPTSASLAYAVALDALCFVCVWLLYRNKLFIKL